MLLVLFENYDFLNSWVLTYLLYLTLDLKTLFRKYYLFSLFFHYIFVILFYFLFYLLFWLQADARVESANRKIDTMQAEIKKKEK